MINVMLVTSFFSPILVSLFKMTSS